MKPLRFNRYVPSALYGIIKTSDYPRKDNLYLIIDLIQRKEIYYKTDLQKKYGFAEIPMSTFKQLLPANDNLQKDMNYLVENGFIRRNEFYVKGIIPKSYKIPSEYLGNSIKVKILNKNINKRIHNQILAYQNQKAKNLEFAQTEYFKNFKIDINGAFKAIIEKTLEELKALSIKSSVKLTDQELLDIMMCRNEYKLNRLKLFMLSNNELDNILHRYMSYNTRVNAINDGYLFFKRNETNGRLDTNLTSLPSFLRPYIKSPELLMSIDIKNSQPYFLYTQLIKQTAVEKVELDKYGKMVLSGTLYDFLLEEYNESNRKTWLTKKEMKVILFKIFYSKTASFKKYKEFFGSHFPTIMRFINKENTSKNNALAIKLTNIESHAILDVIMQELNKQGLKPYTIHDSFVCQESEVARIESIVKNKLIEIHGYAPSLRVELIDKVEEPEIEDEDDNWFELFCDKDDESFYT